MDEVHEITYMKKEIKRDENDKYFETYIWDRKLFDLKSSD